MSWSLLRVYKMVTFQRTLTERNTADPKPASCLGCQYYKALLSLAHRNEGQKNTLKRDKMTDQVMKMLSSNS